VLSKNIFFSFFDETKLTHRNLSNQNLRPGEEHTPRSQANTTRPTQVGSKQKYLNRQLSGIKQSKIPGAKE